MANLTPTEISKLYNKVWVNPGSILDFHGLTLVAWQLALGQHRLFRYNNLTQMETVWAIHFEFDKYTGSRNNLVLPWGSINQSFPGLVTTKKISGDLDAFRRDFTLLKMFHHEWMD